MAIYSGYNADFTHNVYWNLVVISSWNLCNMSLEHKNTIMLHSF